MKAGSTFLILVWLAFSGLGHRVVLAEAPFAAVEILQEPSAGTVVKGKTPSVETFAGRAVACRWLIHQPLDLPIHVELDIFLAMSATVVPLQKGIVLADDVRAADGNPYLASYQFAVPVSERPLRYLLRLRVSSMEPDVDHPVAVVAAVLFVEAAPNDLLEKLAGMKILAVGFGTAREPWMTLLSDAGVNVAIMDISSDVVAVSKKSREQYDAVLLFCPIGNENKLESSSAELAKIASHRIFVFDEDGKGPVVSILEKNSDERLSRFGMDLLDQLADSPSSQRSLIRLLLKQPIGLASGLPDV